MGAVIIIIILAFIVYKICTSADKNKTEAEKMKDKSKSLKIWAFVLDSLSTVGMGSGVSSISRERTRRSCPLTGLANDLRNKADALQKAQKIKAERSVSNGNRSVRYLVSQELDSTDVALAKTEADLAYEEYLEELESYRNGGSSWDEVADAKYFYEDAKEHLREERIEAERQKNNAEVSGTIRLGQRNQRT